MSFRGLRVYQAAQRLRDEVDRIIAKVPCGFENEVGHVNDAADSVLNNIAEGNAFTYLNKQKYFYQVAKGSANEVGGGLQSLVDRKAVTQKLVFKGIGLAIVVAKMLKEMIE